MDKLDQESLQFILESAILAPSADNQHRIRFKLDGNTIQVHYTDAVLPPQGGYKWVLILLSLGAVAENLAIAASHVGMGAETTLYPDVSQPLLVMQIHLQPNQATGDPLWQAIPLRHTNRKVRFRGPKMTGAEQDELGAAVLANPACELVWLDEPARRRQALRLMHRAETERFRNRFLHEELFSAIRFDVGWHASCAEGLPPGALGVEPPLRPFFALLRHWPVMRLVNLLGAHHMLGWRSCDLPCRLAPHLGLLAVKNIDSQPVFDAGRSFQRLWLAATVQGRVLQPMPASALYALEGARLEGIPDTLIRRLQVGWRRILPGGYPLMIFRMGRAPSSAVATERKPLAFYLNTKA
jgi:hypothetical protein